MDDIVTFSNARQNLAALMDRVTENHEAVAVTRGNKPPVIMISLEDFRGYEETAYLMSTETNRNRLLDSIRNAREGKNQIAMTQQQLDALINDANHS